jgi:drug/metabolite transporter (DMT)-like permease
LGRAVNNLTDRSGDQARTTGVVYLLISSICFSFAGVFTKGVEAGSWDVIFWRAGFGLVFLIIFYLGTGKIARQVNLKPSGIMISLIAVISTTAFISSFKHTSIANVAMIYASTPMLAGFLGWWVMREHISRKEFVASIVVLFGVAVVVHGSLGTINIYGDTLAILMAITMAMIIVLFRRFPETPSGGVNMLSCIVLMPICMLFGDPFAASSHDLFLLAVFAILFVIGYITLQEGSKLLPPTLTALLSILETPLAPVWAWLILSEIPVLSTLIGGVIVIVAIVSATVRFSSRT